MGNPKGDVARRSKSRPSSSSSLAASPLPSGSAAAAEGFGGYTGSSRFETSKSNEASASFFLDSDSEVAQHLKRLSKKDPNTKVKALSSLSKLIKQKRGNNILPKWTFEYKKLILDYNRDVRRATHDVMTNVVTFARRDLAPHLESIMGPLWFSQFDLATKVSQAAQLSLQAAFPTPEKRLHALNFCSAEIFAYLVENLKLTPQNLSDRKLASDELKEMYQQMISSSLLSLATLLEILLREPDEAGSANNNCEPKPASKARAVATSSAKKLFSLKKSFPNFLESKSPSIRSATYSLLSCLIKYVPEVFDEGKVRCLAPALLWAELSNGSIPPIQRTSAEMQELGRCILKILLGINLLEQNLLSCFCKSVQEKFLDMLQQGNLEIVAGCMRKMIDFLLLFERNSDLEGESWPLDQFMGPLLSKAFPLIRSSELLDGLKLLSVSVSVFGPRKIVQVLVNDIETSTLLSVDQGRDMSPENFVEVFQKSFVPWCLDNNGSSIAAKQDLLLSLFDCESFTQQWNFVISYVCNQQDTGCNHLAVMTMLLEKARGEITKRSSGQESNQRIGSRPEDWHDKFIEATAISLVCSSSETTTSSAQFLCSVLGGSTEDSSISFVPRSSLVLIYEGILGKLLCFIKQSLLCSVIGSSSYLSVENIKVDLSSTVDMIMVVKFAAEVIDGSFFSLKALNKDAILLPTILSSILIIDLESRVTSLVGNTQYKSKEKTKNRNLLFDFIHAVCSKMDNQFWKSIDYEIRKISASILVQSLRSVVIIEGDLQPCELTLLCTSRMTEVLEYLSLDQSDICGLLLIKSDEWPIRVSPSTSASINTHDMPVDLYELRKPKRQIFVSFINSLIMKMGIHRFLVDHKDDGFASQARLAVEILCTWEWPGSNVQTSFLPMLVSFCKSEPSSCGLLNSMFDILLNSALSHGVDEIESFGNMCVDFNNNREDVVEPVLRALVSLLYTLFKEDLWRGEEAITAFKKLTDKLYTGEEMNRNCLRIIPFIMNILISPLRTRKTSGVSGKDASLPWQSVLDGWLNKPSGFPPLVHCQIGRDMCEWYQLFISCYPVSKNAEEAEELQRHVSNNERILLLSLFRKQRIIPSVVTQLPAVQILLRLIVIAVSYCGKYFGEDDWDFVFSNLKRLIQSAVDVMEETSQNVNEFINGNCLSGLLSMEKRNDAIEGLESIVLISDPSINNAQNALSAFSLLNALVKHKLVEGEDNLKSLAVETWDLEKDRILEGVLRLSFFTGFVEATAASYSPEAASIVASFRVEHLQFWELVGQLVVDSSQRARDSAVSSVKKCWFRKDYISSLYAIMYSSKPIPALQLAAYIFLSTEPISSLAIVTDRCKPLNDESNATLFEVGTSLFDHMYGDHWLRDEVSGLVKKLNDELLVTGLTAPERVQTFLGWSLLLSHVNSLPLTQGRERMVKYIEKTANPRILVRSLLQHLELYKAQRLKKKDGDIPSELSISYRL